ncbi:hypothetical protein CSW98_15925 [Vibrio sp. HA2012]|uniref:DNA circularization N-terminal domain-containing protein n=1 Tax=Vibrio sp. HA2012 TaxID=1971595 RepID=UPI000C2CC0B7|nr:DNA circularization N-terminal domain-containing protein [Vibrio sp. HA2012]PJC85314.1 hypothetical protein CSW98_15925 [Vibrio sp. HA2012]
MWERQYEHGRWNGHQLNILATAIDGGQRLHVSEIPYAQLPHIRVMGSKARTIKLDVVFVGSSSLSDANAFIANLEESPTGELEHPWLGELPLIYETFSQNISTKRGIVTLNLSFIRAGTQPDINTATIIRTKEQTADVEKISRKSFITEVKEMNVSEVNQTQSDFTEALNVLVDITHRLNLDDATLQGINQSINESFTSVSSLSNSPDAFSEQFSSTVDVVASGVQSEADSESEAIDNSRSAQSLMLGQVKANTASHHYNVLMTTGAVKMSKDLSLLEKEERFDITSVSKQPDIIKSDLSTLLSKLDDRINEVTQVSTSESIELFDSLIALKSNIRTQYDKAVTGSTSHRTVQYPRFKPALVIAHDERAKESIITAINALQHPLFFRGDIAVRDDA